MFEQWIILVALLRLHDHLIIAREIITILIKKIIYSQRRTIIAIYSLPIIIVIHSLKQIIIEAHSLSIFNAIHSSKQTIIAKKAMNYRHRKLVNKSMMLQVIALFYAIIALTLYLESIKDWSLSPIDHKQTRWDIEKRSMIVKIKSRSIGKIEIINETMIATMIAIRCALYANQSIGKMNASVTMSEIAMNAQLENDRFAHMILWCKISKNKASISLFVVFFK